MTSPIDPAVDPEIDPVLARSHLTFPVVGVGASAGGLSAVGRLLEHMPAESGMSFVVVLHLAPDHESQADAIFQQSTRMPVREVRGEVPIEPNHVYVIPPGQALSMSDGHLRLGRLERRPERHLAIDLFFRSLGEAHRERAVAVVLTGAGSDGAEGLKRIKERGGVTLVQSPADAEYESMPLNAIATGVADFVLPIADMPDKLVELWTNARRIELPRPPQELAALPVAAGLEHIAEAALTAVMRLLHETTGHDFSHYKRATVLRRIERRMQVSRQPTLPRYAAYLRSNPTETGQLLQDMLISVTNFFRDRQAFDALERAVMTDLSEERSTAGDRVRAWVTGCATGEEAYSVAMVLLEHASDAQRLDGVQVFATDIDERALAVGRTGIYADSIVTDVPPLRLRRFFHREAGQYHVSRALRERVTFSVHNLLRDPPFSRLDLICCRNLLIYLDRAAQRQVLETFHFALRPGGLLFLGSAETADAAPEQYTVVDRKYRIYRASVTVPSRPVPAALTKTLGYLEPLASGNVPQRRQVLDEIRAELLAHQPLPAAVVDQQLKVAYLSADANRYLQLNSGELSAQLLHLVLPELRLSLRAAIVQAQQTDGPVRARRVPLHHADSPAVVDMTVQPVRLARTRHAAAGWLIVLFDEPQTPPEAGNAHAPSDAASALAARADSEFRALHEQLAAAVNQSNDSNEALRGANEELQSLNEELRSTSEELETSKEELQSVNEELVTVNQDLKLHLEATAKTNDDLQNFIAASAIAIVFVDSSLSLQRFTPPATGLFNLLPTDVGRPLFDITHRLDYPEMEGDAREAFGSLRPVERKVPSSDGRWFLVRVLPYRSSADRIEGAVLNFIDVTALHHAEEALRTGEERLRLLFDSSSDYVIFMLDTNGRVTTWSKGAERALGYTEAEAIGQPGDIIFTAEDRAAGAPEEELRNARQSGRAEDERWHVRADGSPVYFSGVMVSLGHGAEKGYAKIARDLTQARLAEQQRDALLVSEQSLRTELQAASALKDEFLAVMSHELKNPLNLIALSADLLARQPEARSSEMLARIAETIGAGVRSQGQLIDDLLDLSRLQTGKLVLHRETVDVDVLVRRMVDALRPDAQERGVALELRLDGGDYRLDADPVRIEQIVWNLLGNALKFTPRGGSVEVVLATDAAAVRLSVADTGSGIRPEFLPLVFEMFRQADARPTTRGKGGLGIGLAIVKRLVDAHGGQVTAASPGPGQGATFNVVLPRQPAPAPAGETGAASAALRGLRVLLIDDERETLELFATVLRVEGAVLTMASSAEEALAQAAPGRFDLIVSDIGMPGMDGYALLPRLREAGLQDVPALALTGFARPHDRERALAAGFGEHLGKPIVLDAFMSAIERLLAGRRD